MVPRCLLLPLINPFLYLYWYVFCVSCVLCVLWCDPVLFLMGSNNNNNNSRTIIIIIVARVIIIKHESLKQGNT